MSKSAIVIGAGVIGSSVAWELAKNGYSVTVVDKESGAGQGSTSASSAVIRFNYSTFDSVALAWESYRGWQNWPAHLGIKLDHYAEVVNAGVVMVEVPFMPFEPTEALFKAVGIPYEIWGAAELALGIPGFDTGKYWPPKQITDDDFWDEANGELTAMYTKDGGYVNDPLLAAQNLAAAAVANGAVMKFRTAVTGIIKNDERVLGVSLSDGSELYADIVINVGGPWSGKINEMAGVGEDFTISVRPMRQEVHHISTPLNLLTGPMIGDMDLGTYMRPSPGGAILLGGTEPECEPLEWVDDLDNVNMVRTQALFESQVMRVARRLPALQMPSSPSGIVGIYDVAADWTPIYDKTNLPGYYVAMGTSGNQFKNAPFVGKLMFKLISEVEAGADHDNNPVEIVGEYTGHKINIGTYSRKRKINENSSGTVMG